MYLLVSAKILFLPDIWLLTNIGHNVHQPAIIRRQIPIEKPSVVAGPRLDRCSGRPIPDWAELIAMVAARPAPKQENGASASHGDAPSGGRPVPSAHGRGKCSLAWLYGVLEYREGPLVVAAWPVHGRRVVASRVGKNAALPSAERATAAFAARRFA